MAASLMEEISETARAVGLDAVGVAAAEVFEGTRRDLEERRAAGLHGGMQFTYRNPARSTDPRNVLPSARSIVVGARRYRRADPERPAAPTARVARYARDDDYGALRRSLDEVAGILRASGFEARVVLDDNALVDREAAVRAGLGWYGKSSNVLLGDAGSWFVLGSVVTDAPLPVGERMADGCGTCRRCLDACPTGAIVESGVVDARRCLAWLLQAAGDFPREHRVALGDRLYGCDDCQEVCPPNVRTDRAGQLLAAPKRRSASSTAASGPVALAAEPTASQAWVDVLELLDLDDEALLARFGRWYIPERDPRYLRRNALVVLGNLNDVSVDGERGSVVGEAVAAALVRHLAGPDPLLATHAAWAALRLGRGDLLAEVAEASREGVAQEVSAFAAAAAPDEAVGAS